MRLNDDFDALSAIALGFALVILAALLALATLPNLRGSAHSEASFSSAMRGESNGETGRDNSISSPQPATEDI